MIILGIDPGSTRIGYGVIETAKGLSLIDCGIIGTDLKSPNDQLLENVQRLSSLMKKYRPAIVSIEKIYFSKNVKTGIAVAQTRGALIAEISRYKTPIKELGPSEIKLAVTGYGFADKKAVAKMVKLILKIKDDRLKGYDDLTDALAIAIAGAGKTIEN
ncbi:MAG: crossover junction endodeoxyribonuclease RuvC [bacterium]|nr:crossover junction endodeoxyribonuclease RuvC [bacterium]